MLSNLDLRVDTCIQVFKCTIPQFDVSRQCDLADGLSHLCVSARVFLPGSLAEFTLG